MIAAKKPVFIDKPLASTLADAQEIARLAKEAGAPWFSASQRVVRAHASGESREHGHASDVGGASSWVFPRPWYQDELDWLASGRTAAAGMRPWEGCQPS